MMGTLAGVGGDRLPRMVAFAQPHALHIGCQPLEPSYRHKEEEGKWPGKKEGRKEASLSVSIP